MDYECSDNFNQKKCKSGNLVIKIESSDPKNEMPLWIRKNERTNIFIFYRTKINLMLRIVT